MNQAKTVLGSRSGIGHSQFLWQRLIIYGFLMAFLLILSVASVGFAHGDHETPGIISSAIGTDGQELVSNAAAINRTLIAQSNGDTVYAICKVGQFRFGSSGGTEVWGYTAPSGVDYAIMGMNSGVVFVNTTTLEFVDVVIGPSTSCGAFGTFLMRDIATIGDYCYVVSECTGQNQGLQVIDMSFLPDSVHLVGVFQTSATGTTHAHFIAIDTVREFLYIEGEQSAGRAVHVHDISNRTSPVYVTSFGTWAGHSMAAHNDTAYIAEGNSPFFTVWDMADKLNPVVISRTQIANAGYVHDICPTGDRRSFVTTEFNAGKTVKIWNAESLSNVVLAGEFLGPSNLSHSAQVIGDTLFLAHLESGISVLEISDPANPKVLGWFDTFETENATVSGAFSVYPYSPNGFIYVAHPDGRLFILDQRVVELQDSITISQAQASLGTKVRVDVSASNTLPARQFVIPISWSGPSGLRLDSASTAGLRTDTFEEFTILASDSATNSVVYRLTSSLGVGGPALESGSGNILSLFFTSNASADTGTNVISIAPVLGFDANITFDCNVIPTPELTSGKIVIVGCCTGQAGNVDADANDIVDIADLTFLIDHLFINFPPLACSAEGNVDGDPAGIVDIADLTFLIDHLFINFPPTAACQ